jgi:RNA recognition motif-containing protein
MDIFVGNLPGKTSVLDLRKLVGQMRQARYRIIHRRYRDGQICCYGHAIINGRKTADEIIRRLNGHQYKGRQLSVRPLFNRNEYNERRIRRVFCSGWNGVNRRRQERRQHLR